MKHININERQGIETVKFPDGQYHVELHKNTMDGGSECVTVTCAIRNPVDLYLLMATSNALNTERMIKVELIIPYLMGARSDRVMVKGDSVDLRVVADMINTCGFEKVTLFDVHSDVALQLIDNSLNIDNRQLVEEYVCENAVLICPDTGAAKKIDKILKWNPNIVEVAHCIKSRDLNDNGRIKLKVLAPLQCSERHCVIVDDLCDGGGTFLAIADQVKFPQSMTLIVSHGIFSKGMAVFQNKFDEIITTNSYQKQTKSKLLTIKEISYEN